MTRMRCWSAIRLKGACVQSGWRGPAIFDIATRYKSSRTVIACYCTGLAVFVEEAAAFHTIVHVVLTPRLGGDQAKVELESICEGCDAFCPAWVLAHHHSFLPILYIRSDPSCDQRFCMEVVDRLAEEALCGWSLSPSAYAQSP